MRFVSDQRGLRSWLAAFSMTLLLTPAWPAFAQQPPSETAVKQSDPIWAEIKRLHDAQDYASARKAAADASRQFDQAGEVFLAASYAVIVAGNDARLGEWQRLDAENFPRLQARLDALDPFDVEKGDELIALVMDAQGALGQRDRQDALGALYTQRIRVRGGDLSEAELSARIRVAYSFLQTGDVERGDKLLGSALKAAAMTDHHAFTVFQYSQAGQGFQQIGEFDRAERVFAEGAESKAAQQNVGELADFYLQYAMLKASRSEIAAAVPMFVRSIEFFDQLYGSGSEESLYANDKLAVELSRTGSPASSTNLAGRNYETSLSRLGPDHNMTWKLANNYADMLREIGAPSKAMEYDAFVIGKRIGYYGPNHFNVLVSVNNMAQNYFNLGQYAEARRYFQQNRDIAVALDRKDADYVAQAETWIFYTDLASGALPLDDVNAARLASLVDDRNYPDILRIKAATLTAQRLEAARKADEGLAVREAAYGVASAGFSQQHPISFDILLGIANAKAAIDPAQATQAFAALDRDMFDWMIREVGTAGNRFVAESTRALADDMLFDFAHLATEQPAAAGPFAQAVTRWKSMGGGKQAGLRALERQLEGKDAQALDLVRQNLRLGGQMQELLSSGDVNDWSRSVASRLQAAEKALDQRLATLGLDPSANDAGVDDLSDLLAPDEGLVNFFVARKWKADRQTIDPFEKSVLYAIVMRQGAFPKIIDLGDSRATTGIGAQYQVASLRGTRSAVPITSVRDAFAALHQQLITPLQPSMEGVKTLYVVPDGELYAVPFALLQDEVGTLLEDRFTVRMLTRPDALYGVHANAKLDTSAKILLAGGLDYRKDGESGAEPLPGTKREVDAIAALASRKGAATDVLTGAQAGEAVLREQIVGARVAHLATHGSYGSEQAGGEAGVDALWQSEILLSRSGDRRSMTRNPDDGRLYAFEMMDWDLSGLDLLVLSACETGRGEESFVSGLRGLPTAIGIAGARRSLLTLWPVADEGTANFMIRFYEHLESGATYPEALRLTRREAIDGKVASAGDPLVWAAFVMFEN